MQRVIPDDDRFDPEFDSEMAECPWRAEPDYGWDAPKRVDLYIPQPTFLNKVPR
jgi:hypothetical protein